MPSGRRPADRPGAGRGLGGRDDPVPRGRHRPGDELPDRGRQAQSEHAVGLSLVVLLLLAVVSTTAGAGMVRIARRRSLLVAARVVHLVAAVALATAGVVFLAAGALLGATTVTLAAVVPLVGLEPA